MCLPIRPWAALVIVAGATLWSVSLTAAPSAGAATVLTVTSTADTNSPGTLRFALTAANATNGDVEIDMQAGLGAVTLTSALPVYTGGGGNHTLTINGAGATIYGLSSSDVLASTSSGLLDVSQMTVTGGANGIDDSGGDVRLTNVTVTGNQLSGVLTTTGAVTLVYDTVADNAAAGAPQANVRTASGAFTAFGSVVAGAPAGAADCAVGGAATSHGFDWSDDASCAFTAGGDHENQDPGLGSPGTTCQDAACTEFFEPGSPLIDAIPAAQCQADGAAGVTDDEIGTARPHGNGCDIGAIEVDDSSTCACPANLSYGYTLVGADGGVFDFGDAQFEGSLPGMGVEVSDIVGMTPLVADGLFNDGYWLVGADGGVFAFGFAPFEGSLPALGIHVHDIVGMVATLHGQGYWLVGADGAVFAFGDAAYDGSLPSRAIHVDNIVGIENYGFDGYTLAGANGGVYTFGPGTFSAWPGFGVLAGPVVGIGGSSVIGGPSYLVGVDGGVFTLGDAFYDGSLPAEHVSPRRPIVGIAAAPDLLNGYWLAGADGGVFAMGLPYLGGMAGRALAAPIVGIANR